MLHTGSDHMRGVPSDVFVARSTGMLRLSADEPGNVGDVARRTAMNRVRKKYNAFTVRETKGVTYAEAVKRMERNEERAIKPTLQEEKTNQDEQNICMDKRKFLAFIAMVINCAFQMQGRSERIKMVLDAANRFLDIDNISGEDIDCTLREGFAPTQTLGSG